MELSDHPNILDTQLDIKIDKDTDECGSHVDIQTIDGSESLQTNQMTNMCNSEEKLNWVAVHPSAVYGPTKVFDSQTEIKIEKDVDGYGSCVGIQTTADNENLETYQPMNICNDATKLNLVAGHASVFHEPPSKCQNSLHTKEKTLNTKAKCFHCDICNKSFSNLSRIKRHMLIHGDKSHHCETCDRAFAVPDNLKRHQIVHTGEKPFKCNICEKRYTRSHHLSIHMLYHTRKRPYKCKSCGESFSQSCTLKNHSLTHTNVKSYICERWEPSGSSKSSQILCGICKKSFTKFSSLKCHIVTHRARLHSCDTCGRSFRLLTSLRNHKRKHSGEKPYKCDICRKKFTFQRGFLSHMRLHAVDRHYKCKSGGKSIFKSSNLKIQHFTHSSVKQLDNAAVSMEQIFTRTYEIAEMRIEIIERADATRKQNVSESRTPDPKIKRHKSSDEIKNEGKDPNIKPCDGAVGNRIKFQGLILRSKESDNASISMEQSSKMKNDIAKTSKTFTDQADETKHSNTLCLLESIKQSKEVSSAANYATKFCDLDLRRRIAHFARSKRNNNV